MQKLTIILAAALLFTTITKAEISDWGIGPPGMGQIVQVSFNCEYVGADTKNN